VEEIVMQVLIDAGLLLASYIIGSIPFGLIVVKLMNGKDIRTVASGRTGGTNAMRAAGPWAGVLTAVFDVLKAAVTVWLAQAVTPNVWIHLLAPLAAVIGHNHSIFLIVRNQEGQIRLGGGAGGAAAGGGAFGLWPPVAIFLIPLGLLIWYVTGYASVTTLSIGLLTIIIFGVRAALGLGPWEYMIYGFLVEILMTFALLPNLKRLREGTERRHGLPVKLEQLKRERGQKKDGKTP
jgi:glycerol-3-phosphate acyltransferase PlsY